MHTSSWKKQTRLRITLFIQLRSCFIKMKLVWGSMSLKTISSCFVAFTSISITCINRIYAFDNFIRLCYPSIGDYFRPAAKKSSESSIITLIMYATTIVCVIEDYWSIVTITTPNKFKRKSQARSLRNHHAYQQP